MRYLVVMLITLSFALTAFAQPKAKSDAPPVKHAQVLKHVVTNSPYYEVKLAALGVTYPLRHPLKTFHFLVF